MIILDVTKKVRFNYFILDTYEAGLILESWEVKGVRQFGVDILGSYVAFDKLCCFLYNSYIKPVRTNFYKGEFFERRNRMLLLKKREIMKLCGLVKQARYTIVPLKVYWHNNFVKISIAVCVGKKKYDKREKVKDAEWVSIKGDLGF